MKHLHLHQSTAKLIAAILIVMLMLAALPVKLAYAVAPTATTNAASALRRVGAQLNGTVNAGSESTTVTFQYGLTVAYGSTVTAAQSPVTGNVNTAVNFILTGLTPNTLYHYRVVAVNASGTTYGADVTFTTRVLTPTTYYVDHTNVACNDAGAGTTPALPFCTIGRGAVVADAGDTVRVLTPSTPYTYPETVRPSNNGGAGIPITFSAAPGVTVTGDGTATGSAFRITNKVYITVDGFSVTNTRDEGIYVFGSDHITVSNNHISYSGNVTTDTHKRGIWLNTTTNSVVDHNITDHNSCIGIRLIYSDYNTVSNNISYANASVVVSDAAGIELTGSSNNTVIHNTTYGNEDTGINIYVHASGQGSNNNFIIGNLTYGNHDHGIDTNGSTNQTIIGNTVQGNYTSGINLELNSIGSTVMNNIVADNGLNPAGGRKPYNIYVDDTSVAGTTLDYNLYYLTSPYTLQIDWNNGNYTLAAFKAAVPGQEVNGFEANPLFYAPAVPATDPFVINTGDYHLTAGSPAIDSANSNAPSEPTLDLDGNSRVDDALVANTGAGVRTYDDRGAYEYQPPADQTITFTSTAPASAIYGGPTYTPTATATSGLPVTITVDATASTVCSITGGVVSFIGVGLCVLDANQPGNAYYHAAPQVQQSFTVGKANTTTTITSDLPDPSVVGQAVTINFTVAVNAPGSGTPTGNVTVSDGTQSCTGTVAAGTCSITFTTAGAKLLTATYAGDSNFNGSTSVVENHTVNAASTTTTITSDLPDPSVVGQAVPIYFTVAANAPGSGTPTGNVTVSDGTQSCTGTVAAGTCSITFTTAGAKSLTATYAGDSNFNGSVSAIESHFVAGTDTTITITSDLPDPSLVGEAVTINFTVTVNPPGTGTPTGNVTVSDGTQSCTGTVAAGTCSITFTTAGAKSLTATYAGDLNFNPNISAAVSHAVNQAPAITSPDHIAFTVGAAGSTFTVTTTGYPVSSITRGGAALPSGLTWIDNGDGTGTLSGTPASGTLGTYNITFTASNGIGSNAVQNFTLTVVGGPVVSNVNTVHDTGDGRLDEKEVVIVSVNRLVAVFSGDVINVPALTPNYNNSVINPANYLLVYDNGDGIQTHTCNTAVAGGGVIGGDSQIPVNTVLYSNNGGSGPFVATLNVNGGVDLPNGTYRLIICGSTSITNLGGLKLAGDGHNEGTDFIRNFMVSVLASPSSLPATGFAPNRVSVLPVQPADKAYSAMGSLWLEIPKLGVKMNIVGVPQGDGSWDVSWLGNDAGWLEGSAFPTRTGNSVLTGHVWNANNTAGPFRYINTLSWGDKIIIHSSGVQYVYEVRSVKEVTPTNISAMLKHEDASWVTLVTCRDFDAATGTYKSRMLVKAVLVEIK